MEAGSASEEKSSGSVRRMSLSLPGNGYGNTFVDERENNMDKCPPLSMFFRACAIVKKRKTVRDMSYGDHVGSNPNVLIKGEKL